jgi:hypothetical protein
MIAYFIIVLVVACFFESDATYIAHTTARAQTNGGEAPCSAFSKLQKSSNLKTQKKMK